MLVDRLRKLNLIDPENDLYFNDAVVFFIDESVHIFIEKLKKVGYMEPLIVSRLPFSNIVIQFKDWLFWCREVRRNELSFNVCITYYSKKMLDMMKLKFKELKYIPQVVTEIYTFDINLNFINASEQALRSDGLIETEFGKLSKDAQACIFSDWIMLNRFLELLSCKNIITVKKPGGNKKKSKTVKPLVSYYTLQIKSLSRKLSQNRESRDLWSNRIHFCRGHMREYTRDAPLFGKYVGRFWIPPHVRGNKKQGIIYKDYEVLEKKMSKLEKAIKRWRYFKDEIERLKGLGEKIPGHLERNEARYKKLVEEAKRK